VLWDVASPRLHTLVTNARLGDMIEDEGLIRMEIHEFDVLRKMLLKDQEVISEIELFQLRDTSIEIISQNELVIRLIVNRMTYCLHFWESSNSLEFGGLYEGL
jgi:hypothetical protein